MRALVIAPTLILAFAACSSETKAQPNQAPDVGSGTAALTCYVRADARGLERPKAIDLCLGAASVAPALCFEAVVDRVDLDDTLAVNLCRGATSTEPAGCAERLEGRDLPSSEIVRYCAALGWPIIAVPTGGSSACLEVGMDRTQLTDQEVIRLCRGSTDASPIDCFEAGEDATSLTDHDVVTLCAKVMVDAPGSPLPPAY
jgi:hypothetical protein